MNAQSTFIAALLPPCQVIDEQTVPLRVLYQALGQPLRLRLSGRPVFLCRVCEKKGRAKQGGIWKNSRPRLFPSIQSKNMAAKDCLTLSWSIVFKITLPLDQIMSSLTGPRLPDPVSWKPNTEVAKHCLKKRAFEVVS